MTLDTPANKAGGAVVGSLLARVNKAAARAAKARPRSGADEQAVHALRVAIRRAEAAVCAFESLAPKRTRKRALGTLRALRKAAGTVRDEDVRMALLDELARSHLPSGARGAIDVIKQGCNERRARAGVRFGKVLSKQGGRALEEQAQELVGAIRGADDARPLRDVAQQALGELFDRVAAASSEDLADLEHLHALRIELKALRYGLEVFADCYSKEFRAKSAAAFASVQEAMGAVNDADVLHACVQDELERRRDSSERRRATPERRSEVAAIKALARHQRARRDRAHAAFERLWRGFDARSLMQALRAELSPPPAIVEVKPPVFRPAPQGLNGIHRVQSATRPRRIAAIDIGTNSVRLIIAEASPDGSYRVLDDEKEVTRLGRGLGATGKLDAHSIEHTAATIANMRAIAEGYGAKSVRAVATAAAREASNGAALISAIRERAGLKVEVISGEQEATLAFKSAARAFDLAAQPSAVIDIGGGSMEVIFVAPQPGGGRGVIERAFSLPLGAVRLTEQFGGAGKAAGAQYRELRKYVKRTLEREIGRPPLYPALVIGTGGTVTTLASMARERERTSASGGLRPTSVQGADVSRPEIKHLLEHLRHLPVKDRAKVPGLPPDRADIIVAGLVSIDVVLKFLGANRIRAHEGGIRDGLLLEMIGENHAADAGPSDPMHAVQRFAEACSYEAAHSNHVTELAVRIFDLLAGLGIEAPGVTWAARERLLLQAASMLHDVGYLIGYAEHHKHSYHLITHANLQGFSQREVQVIANVARYHRAAEPKPRHAPFAAMSEDDQRLIVALAAILRVADGLDRTHTQSVKVGSLEKLGKGLGLSVTANAEPRVDMWGASRKSGLFERTFSMRLGLTWTRGSEQASGSENSAKLVRKAPSF